MLETWDDEVIYMYMGMNRYYFTHTHAIDTVGSGGVVGHPPSKVDTPKKSETNDHVTPPRAATTTDAEQAAHLLIETIA